MKRKLSKRAIEKIHKEVVAMLSRIYALAGLTIYVNGRKESYKTNSPDFPEITKDVKASDYCEYANDDTITLVYDGGYLYSIMSCELGYHGINNFDREIGKILEPVGMYYEQGSHWYLSLYESSDVV